MQVQSTLFFERIEQIYARIFRSFRPRTPIPSITVRFRKYANANSRILLHEDQLTVDISDLLETAPAPVQEALASILLAKLFRCSPERAAIHRYRRYLNRSDMRHTLHEAKQQRGRKSYLPPAGRTYDLVKIFEEINFEYFNGLMARPELGWSPRPSRTVLGHYDPSHHVIVITRLFDTAKAPELIVKYVVFHEMLHLKFPAEVRGVRRCVHTKEFREAERRFRDFSLANEQLNRFVEQAVRSPKLVRN